MTPYGLLRAGFTLLFGYLLVVGLANAQTDVATIRMRDACDPTTFNQVVGPGACIPGQHGTTKFQFFTDEVADDHLAGAWRFNPLFPRPLHVPAGQLTVIENEGGEIHTFTKVAKFGGGFVSVLNLLSGNPVPAPECLKPPSATNIFVEAGTTETGPTAGTSELPAGTTHFQCCIHPWMRLNVVVP
jgi:hypothetical protein